MGGLGGLFVGAMMFFCLLLGFFGVFYGGDIDCLAFQKDAFVEVFKSDFFGESVSSHLTQASLEIPRKMKAFVFQGSNWD